MPKICLYLQLHQPFRLKPFSLFQVTGQEQDYFTDSEQKNKQIFLKVAQKSYVPMLKLLLELVREFPRFQFSLSASGVFLDQAEAWQPEIITLLKALSQTNQVEWLAETYYHSLSSLYSPLEFAEQVSAQKRKIKELFEQEALVFRNTELIYSDEIAQLVAKLGFQGMLTEAVDRYLEGRDRTRIFVSNAHPNLPLLLKHAQLSDDIAFRFSDKNWVSFPLTAPQYQKWLGSYGDDQLINLFMDFETFGEHQWEDTGIFAFFRALIRSLSAQKKQVFYSPRQLLLSVTKQKLPVYRVPQPISWADIDRDLTAWTGNQLQQDALRAIYRLEEPIKKTKDEGLIETWRRLQTSDHFYYMCTKWANDGDVHAYFSPYQNPLEAYNRFNAVLADIETRLAYSSFDS